MSASWISGKNTVLIFWQQENMEKQMLRCLLRQFWMAMLPYWFLVNIKRSRNVFESEREVISVLSVGLLFVTLVGFLSGGVLVDQIETFFTENRREEPETGQNFHGKQKTRTGNGRKKDFLTIAFSSFMIYNRRWGETVGKKQKPKKRAYPGVSVLFAIQCKKLFGLRRRWHRRFRPALRHCMCRQQQKTVKNTGGSGKAAEACSSGRAERGRNCNDTQ